MVLRKRTGGFGIEIWLALQHRIYLEYPPASNDSVGLGSMQPSPHSSSLKSRYSGNWMKKSLKQSLKVLCLRIIPMLFQEAFDQISVILRLFSHERKTIILLTSQGLPDKELQLLEMDYEAKRN
jgi:hypothetical protein